MLPKLRDRLTYANAMSTIALFIALGGGAYALSNDSVKSKHIVDDQVKSADLRDNGTKSEDVKDETLTGDDVDTSTFTWKELPVGGASAAQIRNIGVGGDTMYGGIAGRTPADANVEEIYMAVPLGTVADSLYVAVEDPVSAGQTRTFALVAYPNLAGGLGAESVILECTVQSPATGSGGPGSCDDSTPAGEYNGTYAIRIESSGAGLDGLDDAYVGVSLKSPIGAED